MEVGSKTMAKRHMARGLRSVSGLTTAIAGSPGEISRIEATIRSVTVSGGDTVTLSVDIYGLQDAKDNGLGGTFTWTADERHYQC